MFHNADDLPMLITDDAAITGWILGQEGQQRHGSVLALALVKQALEGFGLHQGCIRIEHQDRLATTSQGRMGLGYSMTCAKLLGLQGVDNVRQLAEGGTDIGSAMANHKGDGGGR